MPGPFLLAQTPRAGKGMTVKVNHRMIVSKGAGLHEDEAAALLECATRQLGKERRSVIGKNYAAVINRDVFQVHDARMGDEILLLGGIDGEAIGYQLEDIVGALSRRLEQLPGVIDGIAWDRCPTSMVEDATCSRWLQDDFQHVPPQRRGSARWLLMAGVCLGLFTVLGAGAVLFANSLSGWVVPRAQLPQVSTKSTTQEIVPDPAAVETANTQFRKILERTYGPVEIKKWTPAKLKSAESEFYYFVKHTDPITPETIFRDRQVRDKLKSLGTRSAPQPFCFVDADPDELPVFANEFKSLDEKDVFKHRVFFIKFASPFQKLARRISEKKDRLEKNKNGPQDEKGSKLSRLFVKMAKTPPVDQEMLPGLDNVFLPFFTSAEQETMKQINQFFEWPELKVLAPVNSEKPVKGLFARMRKLCKDVERIQQEVETQKTEFDRLEEKNPAILPLIECCNHWQDFLKTIGKIDRPGAGDGK